MTFFIRFGSLLKYGRVLRIPHRSLMKLKDEDFSMEFLEGDQKGFIVQWATSLFDLNFR